jgi:hypothetical protein
MKVSLEWIKDFVDIPKKITPQQPGEDLTLLNWLILAEKIRVLTTSYSLAILLLLISLHSSPLRGRPQSSLINPTALSV